MTLTKEDRFALDLFDQLLDWIPPMWTVVRVAPGRVTIKAYGTDHVVTSLLETVTDTRPNGDGEEITVESEVREFTLRNDVGTYAARCEADNASNAALVIFSLIQEQQRERMERAQKGTR